jgi:hypothetical protein
MTTCAKNEDPTNPRIQWMLVSYRSDLKNLQLVQLGEPHSTNLRQTIPCQAENNKVRKVSKACGLMYAILLRSKKSFCNFIYLFIHLFIYLFI